MIGNGYWSTGIIIDYRYAGGGDHGWAAKVEYLDDGFCDDDADVPRISTEGELRTRYAIRQGKTADALTVVIDTIKADAERLGVRWQPDSRVFYKNDGHTEDAPPNGWREMVDAQSARIGWIGLYTEAGRALRFAAPEV